MNIKGIHKPVAPGFGCSASRRRAAGFTLIEAALTTVIIGTGVLALVAAQQAYHVKNEWAQHTGTAQQLANELRELTLTLPMYHPLTNAQSPGLVHGQIDTYQALIDFAGPISDGYGEGVTFSHADDTGPVNALRLRYPELEGWSQEVRVYRVQSHWISFPSPGLPLADPEPDDVMRVTARVQYEGPYDDEPQTMMEMTWVVGR